jgi:DNA-binding NarL/FixJ family response regulator
MKNKIKILIADDHVLIQDALKYLFLSVPDIELVGKATTGQEVIEAVLREKPDVVLMDIQMPEIDGIEATRQIMEKLPQIAIIMLTMFQDDDSVFAAMRAGARGYVLKGADQDVILRAIRSAANGESLFSPEIAKRLMNFFANLRPPPSPNTFPELTDRERELLHYIARGDTNERIAEILAISLKTVRNHVSSIFNKLRVADRTQAAIRAREAGFGPRKNSASQ